MIDRAWQRNLESVFEPIFDTDDPVLEKFTNYANRLADGLTESLKGTGHVAGCRYGNYAVELSTRDPAIREMVAATIQKIAAYFEQAIRDGIRAGELADDVDAGGWATAILSLMESHMFLAEALHRLARDTVRLLVDNGYANEQTRPHWGPPLPSSRRRVLKCLQIFNRLFRLRLARVVRIDFDRTDNTTLVDYESTRHRHGSAVVAIAARRIDAELVINILDDRRHRKAQAELVRISVSRVVQEIERKLVLANHLLVLLWNLRGRRGNGCTQSFNLVVDCLQSIQLCITVGSPNAADHGQNSRSDGEQFRRFNRFAERVGQRESRQAIAHLEHDIHDVRPGQFLCRSPHDDSLILRNTFRRGGAEFIQLCS